MRFSKKFDEIYALKKSKIILLKHYNFYVDFCIERKDLEMLEYLCNDEIFEHLEINKRFFNLDIEITKLIFYRKNKINIDLIIRNQILEYCDLFDQFLTYNPDSLMVSKLITRSDFNKIDIGNWLKIISKFPDCFSFIEDRKLWLHSDESLYIHLFGIGYGHKIDPIFLSVQFVLDNWFYLDMDNYINGDENFFRGHNIIKILAKSPKSLLDLYSNISNKSENKRCFDDHRYYIMKIFTKMKEEDKNIFRELLKTSSLDESRKKFLSNRSYRYSSKNKNNI